MGLTVLFGTAAVMPYLGTLQAAAGLATVSMGYKGAKLAISETANHLTAKKLAKMTDEDDKKAYFQKLQGSKKLLHRFKQALMGTAIAAAVIPTAYDMTVNDTPFWQSAHNNILKPVVKGAAYTASNILAPVGNWVTTGVDTAIKGTFHYEMPPITDVPIIKPYGNTWNQCIAPRLEILVDGSMDAIQYKLLGEKIPVNSKAETAAETWAFKKQVRARDFRPNCN